ncbi:MAG: hypothetical protein LBI48_08355 [Burkholderiaceae bacterium]|nr:hypothetical protein [Burkholderiaceae bacterium]
MKARRLPLFAPQVFVIDPRFPTGQIMPFTPLHMGPGLAVKALLGRRFSLTVFGFSQIAMDIEPLARMIRGDTLLHEGIIP